MSEHDEPMVIFNEQPPIHVGTVSPSRVLRMVNIAELGVTVLAYVKKHPGLNLLLSFENVDYLSSAVLTELLRINQAIQECRGRLRLCAVSPAIQEIFQITRLDTVFSIHGEGVDVEAKKFARAIALEREEKAWESGGPSAS
ncbi:MAG: STAS domain-containing protein [Candidatus Hydrogenedens sp.]|nr:STAS domain-containing protein [Candidatus Hydrogenedentota bacterium]NLF58638.1 STAS domain-containing protein [Candidatus Hydrogenedens sp.]